MPVAKLKSTSTMDALKSEEGNDSIDTIIRQAIGRESVLSFPRTGESPVQWMLHALDQQDLPGWPLLSPMKIQMQKCEKCSREFCSQLNYRRHIRVHRRSLRVDKESHRNRDLLGSFWDKLSVSEAKEVVSFGDVTLEEVPGSSVIRALTTFLQNPGFCMLPQVYIRAGSALLEIIQARSSQFPITSKELFSILDDASERTFLCAGTAGSMQKYVFDGEAGKIGLEMKNLIACASFLLEKKLVKSWLADKDAESLRCQKLLVEEEEAAQKRQAELLERKRQKKLRQKEQQKAKDSTNVEKADTVTVDTSEYSPPAETASPPFASESSSGSSETEGNNSLPLLLPDPIERHLDEEVDIEAQVGFSNDSSSTCQHIDHQRTTQGSNRRYPVIPRRQVPKSQRNGRNGFYANQNHHHHHNGMKPEQPSQRHNSTTTTSSRDMRSGPVVNSNKVWTRKSKTGNDEGVNVELLRLQKEVEKEAVQRNNNCELMIGSISVTLDNYSCSPNNRLDSTAAAEKNVVKIDSSSSCSSRSTVKLWQPVNRQGSKGPMAVQSGINEPSRDENGSNMFLQQQSVEKEEEGAPAGVLLSNDSAKDFLAQRWKEAIRGEHVKLVLLSSQSDHVPPPPGNVVEVVVGSPKRRTILGSAENLPDTSTTANVVGAAVAVAAATAKVPKSRTKALDSNNKGVKLKYVPKQKIAAAAT
ncbi:uncharacterized protein LOC124926095 [Impatiens glandulifera]|uniref:uncharacterized protein LOC124926095 n=1 Tax=Impatiens glandulifera TaxID=253017 RepID=UPI001FB1317B|nr:uncharacterized protein LOC124926095 [Impatiens glandulifera]